MFDLYRCPCWFLVAYFFWNNCVVVVMVIIHDINYIFVIISQNLVYSVNVFFFVTIPRSSLYGWPVYCYEFIWPGVVSEDYYRHSCEYGCLSEFKITSPIWSVVVFVVIDEV